MQLPLQITFRNMNPSEAVESKIRERADKLDRFADHVMSCRVIVEAPHKHHHKGALYQVLIDITVPGKELVVSRAPHDNHAHEDVYVAVRDAFDAARRQLEDYTRVVRGKTKLHEPPPQGRIRNLVLDQDFGVIETIDGREVYFHRNSVLNGDFEKLGSVHRCVSAKSWAKKDHRRAASMWSESKPLNERKMIEACAMRALT